MSSYIAGFLIDHCGRRLTIIANAVVFLIGALILGFSPNFTVLVSIHPLSDEMIVYSPDIYYRYQLSHLLGWVYSD